MEIIKPYATQDDITIYDEGTLLWTDCTQKVDTDAEKAFEGLEHVIKNIHEHLNITPVQNENADTALDLEKGTVMTYRAFKGVIPLKKIHFTIVDLIENQYLRIRIESFKTHLADMDFRIRQEDKQVKLSYRQGCTCKGKKNITMPDTAEIYNLWISALH